MKLFSPGSRPLRRPTSAPVQRTRTPSREREDLTLRVGTLGDSLGEGALPPLFQAVGDAVDGFGLLRPEPLRSALSLGASVETPFQLLKPLTFAVRQGNAQVVAMLLEHGADPLAPDETGINALQVAANQAHASHELTKIWEMVALAAAASESGLPRATEGG